MAGLALALLPLIVWPPLEHPFSTPKLWWLAAATIGLLVVPAARRRMPTPLRWLVALWVASFVVSGAVSVLPAFPDIALGILAPVFALALARVVTPGLHILWAQVLGAGVVALVALLQWSGIDPLTWAGWYAPIEGASVRMRVYGTLGNPNFVGALMALTIPLSAALLVEARGARRRGLAGLLLAVLASALVATGSRGAVLGLAAGAVTWAGLRWSPRALVGVAVVLVGGTAAVALSPARPLQTTLAGRVYLWQVVAPHATARPLVGQGPGAVALRFAGWQQQADTRGISDPRFRGLTDHVHNDYLEALVERGVPGVLTLLAPLLSTCLLVVGRRHQPNAALRSACAASVMAGAACALVDFPLARPVELVWWWTAIALVHGQNGPGLGVGLTREKDEHVEQVAVAGVGAGRSPAGGG